jgi:hypothetical protein
MGPAGCGLDHIDIGHLSLYHVSWSIADFVIFLTRKSDCYSRDKFEIKPLGIVCLSYVNLNNSLWYDGETAELQRS